jgi:hypothetical protein
MTSHNTEGTTSAVSIERDQFNHSGRLQGGCGGADRYGARFRLICALEDAIGSHACSREVFA